MTFSDWLDQERGRVALVADRFAISMSAVTQWRTNGVPVDRMRDLSSLTNGDVPLEGMLPPIHPEPSRAEAA